MAVHTISPDVARRLRLRAQGLVPRRDLSPADVVRRMVAMQGQDLPAVLRAIAIRSRPGTTVDDVRAAFDAGLIVRGWTQRGTLFATTPRDLAALRSLTAARVRHSLRRTVESTGLNDDVRREAAAVAREALADGGVSRATLLDLWRQAGIPTDQQRGYHLIMGLALDGLLHWGPFAGTQQLMVATASASRHGDGTPVPGEPDEELHRIARAYFATHAPATADDLAWWLGLPKTPVRAVVEELIAQAGDAAGSSGPGGSTPLVRVEVAGRPMLASADSLTDGGVPVDVAAPAGVTLVPGFDEIVLGYQDRELVASKTAMETVVPYKNGVFLPAVLLDGRLVGVWRRAPKKDQLPFELVDGVTARDRQAVTRAVAGWEHA